MLSTAEYMTHEPLPRAEIHAAVFAFCASHPELCVFGAQAVNAFVPEDQVRMTQDVDVMAPDPELTADEIARFLHARLHIAARVREVRQGFGYRVYQARGEGDRHLVDVRLVLPELEAVTVGGLRCTSPALTLAMKVIAYRQRRLRPKGATDLADIRRLLLAFPALRSEAGEVRAHLDRLGADEATVAAWGELVSEPGEADDEDDYLK